MTRADVLGMETMIARCISLTLRAFAANCPEERAQLMAEAMELTQVLAPS